MFQALRLIPNLSAGRPVFYMARDIATWVARQAAAQDTDTVKMFEDGGQFTERFHGVPMRRVDALSADEARIT